MIYAEVNEKFNCFVRPGHFSTVSQSFHLVKEFHMDRPAKKGNAVRKVEISSGLSYCPFVASFDY